jgi:dipeptidyl aminopeptidase/acylaminoacyl peptidase
LRRYRRRGYTQREDPAARLRQYFREDLVHLKRLLPCLLVVAATLTPGSVQAGRPLSPEDWFRFQALSDLHIAPDGAAVAYLVTSYDKESDESRSALWMANWAGDASVQLTRGESVSEPRFSPDGRYLSFLSARPAEGKAQLWVLDRRGGEPRQLTHVTGELTGYEWSPDGQHVVLVMRAGEKTPKPIVIDSFQFKADRDGYLSAASRSHLYLLEVRSGACEPLTADSGKKESLPAWSPDGEQIAYVSDPMKGPEQTGIDEIDLIAARAGSTPRQLLSTWSPNRQKLQWTADGTRLALLQGAEAKFNAYIMDSLAVLEVKSGEVRPLTDRLDRAVLSPAFAADGRSLEFAVEDDGNQYPARVTLASGAIERLGGPMVVHELAAAAGHTAVLVSSDRAPVEVYALEKAQLRPLSAHNQALFGELQLGSVEDISFRSRDGTAVHGQLVKPPDYVSGRRYPTIVWIHGGPNGQDDHSLELQGYGPPLERQLFATHGFVVLAINYRGSTGRGAKFARSILADWGHREVEDLLAGVDYAVGKGIADPARLGIGGWSYGGLLTDYVIASDTRFKAAISGAGSGNQLSTYGTDEYIVEYNAELGPPWRNPGLWLKVSYPFFHADRIRTPTLFLGGDKDFNVPIGGGEQMYQALRTLGVPAQLVVYPGEYHVLTRPSFLLDRFRRYLDWMDKYLKDKS